MILVLWEDTRVWVHWKYSLDIQLNCLRISIQSSKFFLLFSILNFSQNPPSGQLETDDLIFVELHLWGTFFIYWNSREHSLSTRQKKKLRWGGVRGVASYGGYHTKHGEEGFGSNAECSWCLDDPLHWWVSKMFVIFLFRELRGKHPYK